MSLIRGTMRRVASLSHCETIASASSSSLCASTNTFNAASQRSAFSTSSVAAAKLRRKRDDNNFFSVRKFNYPQNDSLPSNAQEDLFYLRDRMNFARIVEHELPKLIALRSKFVPPSKEDIARVRTVHRMGKAHAEVGRAKLEVAVSDLFQSGRLASPAARRKLLLLAGPRWMPLRNKLAVHDLKPVWERTTDSSTQHQEHTKSDFDLHGRQEEVERVALSKGVGTIKILTQRFPYEQMNAKWCSDMLDKMIEEANNNPEAMDSIPLDLRREKAQDRKQSLLRRHRAPSMRNYPDSWAPRGSPFPAVTGSDGKDASS